MKQLNLNFIQKTSAFEKYTCKSNTYSPNTPYLLHFAHHNNEVSLPNAYTCLVVNDWRVDAGPC